MNKKIFSVFCVLIPILSFGQQVGKKVETKYLRPSITSLFYQPNGSQEKVIIEKFKDVEMVSKFDDHRISFPYFNGSETIDSYLYKASNLIMAKWWNRDSNGDFNKDLVAKRGEYTATDADAMLAKAASIDRRDMIGEKLISKTYVFLYRINKLRTMEEVYDEIDAYNRKNSKKYKPVDRTDEGFSLNYSVSAYKLNFNDSVSSVFYSQYWTDAKNHDTEKVAKWETAGFPLLYSTTFTGEVRSTQPKDPNSPVYSYTKRKTMNELLEDFPAAMQVKTIDDFSQKIEDFRVKSPVFKTSPLSAKIGTKEGLYLDERYYVYEIVLDKKNNETKHRMGIARVKTIAENSSVATGDSKPSTFQQQGGRKLYEGMLMESRPDKGIVANLGYSLYSPNQVFGGIKLSVEDRISRTMNIPGLFIGIDLGLNAFTDLNPGIIEASKDGDDKGLLTDGTQTFSGATMALAFNIAKEMYFTKRGNVYIKPSIGIGFQNYSFISVNDPTNTIDLTIPDPDDASKKTSNPLYSWSSFYVPLQLSFGWNIFPAVALEVRPELNTRFGATTGSVKDSNESFSYTLKQKSTNFTDMQTTWGFDTIDKLSINTGVTVNLKIKF
jgi:hypothetical protein